MADEIETTQATETENSGTETQTTSTETTQTETTETEKVDLGLGAETETETTETGETETKEGEDEVDARYGAPEGDAGYDIKLGEEGKEPIDAEALAMVTPALKELNLSNESATKLVGTFAEKVLPHYEQQFQKNIEQGILATRTEWEGAARDLIKGKAEDGSELVAKNKAGEVLSFDGSDMKKVQSVAARALDRLAPEGFREFLNESGLGVHPQMVAFAYQVGKAIAEDGEFESGGTPKKDLTSTEKFYGR